MSTLLDEMLRPRRRMLLQQIGDENPHCHSSHVDGFSDPSIEDSEISRTCSVMTADREEEQDLSPFPKDLCKMGSGSWGRPLC